MDGLASNVDGRNGPFVDGRGPDDVDGRGPDVDDDDGGAASRKLNRSKFNFHSKIKEIIVLQLVSELLGLISLNDAFI